MKHIYLPTSALFIALVLFAACSGKKEAKTEQQSDSAATVEMEAAIAGPTEYFLTADSIGPVKVGDKISDLPAAVPNLFDMMIPTETPDAMAYTYLLADVPQFTIYDFMDGKVDVIALEGNARAINTPKGQIRVGDEFTNVLALPGVESEYETMDDMGIWYWKWNGLYFSVDETNLSDTLSEALCDGKRPPRAAMFTPDVKIGYIATGLPF